MTYYVIGADGQQYGPVEHETVEQWIRERKLGPATLAWGEDDSEWSPLDRRAEFYSLFGAGAQKALVPAGQAATSIASAGTGGYVLLMFGAVSVGAGLGISFTGIGACLGIPMVLVGSPMVICGAVMRSRARDRRTDAVLAQAVAASVSRATPAANREAIRCRSCGAALQSDDASCPSCDVSNPRK